MGSNNFKYLHTMMRVNDLDESINFYSKMFGMQLLRKSDYPDGKFTLAFLGYGNEENNTVLELTYNWDPEDYSGGRNFGHLAFQVDDIYETCQNLVDAGVIINRPPRDGYMAFIRTPDNISIELLHKGNPLPPEEPWASMENTGVW